MTQRELYLLRAAELSAKAQTESAGAGKFEFENLARAYLRLAEQAERNLAAIVREIKEIPKAGEGIRQEI
jgi:hypothetical protein